MYSDPPSEPQLTVVLDVGPTWVHAQWGSPTTSGSLPVSGYRITTVPQPRLLNTTIARFDNGSDTTNSSKDLLEQTPHNSTQVRSCNVTNQTDACLGLAKNIEWPTNTACIEVVCKNTSLISLEPGKNTVNLTELVPNLDYLLIITALSNGTNLESIPSDPVHFTTDIYGEIG